MPYAVALLLFGYFIAFRQRAGEAWIVIYGPNAKTYWKHEGVVLRRGLDGSDLSYYYGLSYTYWQNFNPFD